MKDESMKRIYLYLLAATVLCAVSCRPKGDELLSYGQNDYQAFYDAGHSFAGEFKAFWTAMNENYGIWDYEESFGTDWDEVYASFLPKFEELDKREGKVTDQEFLTLYEQITDTLHDGHIVLMIKNLHTGKYAVLQPNRKRIQRERYSEYQDVQANVTDLHTYRTSAARTYKVKEYDGTGSDLIVYEQMETMLSSVIKAADAYLDMVDAAGGPDASNDEVYKAVLRLEVDAQRLLATVRSTGHEAYASRKTSLVNSYNAICREYSLAGRQIGVTIKPIEGDFLDDGLKELHYALFDGNIAYLRIGGFGLTMHLNPEYQSHNTETLYYDYQQAVNRVWHRWFDAIQTLHLSGELGGVIIDVRNNGGGAVNDYQYVLGALLPSGGWSSHTLRMKNGIGRLDYGPLSPFTFPTYEGTHEVVSDRPVVVLANCRSASMSEQTTWGVMSLPNGCFIGTRTSGGLSALNTNPENYSNNYSGAFGVQGVTPIYGYIPKYICLYGEERRIMEGVGFSPDIEVPLDVNLWQMAGRDNQLEEAVDYIRFK